MMQKDKLMHLLVGFVLSLTFGYLYGISVGILVAIMAEVAKITCYDMPRTLVMDWREKRMDMLAQMVGAALGAVLVFLWELYMPASAGFFVALNF